MNTYLLYAVAIIAIGILLLVLKAFKGILMVCVKLMGLFFVADGLMTIYVMYLK